MAANEIVEMKDGKAIVTTVENEKMLLQLSKTYEFEGEKISQLDLSGLEEITADNMIKANKVMVTSGAVAIMP